MHTGIRLAAANQYLQGKHPYTEIFFGYGPQGSMFQPLLAFKIWGRTLAAHRLLDWFVDPLGLLTLYFLSLVAIQTKTFVLLFIVVLLGHRDISVSSRSFFPFASLSPPFLL